MKIFSTINNDSKIRNLSSSGGIFSILSEEILNQGGYIYGASFNKNWEVEHIVINQKEDIDKLRRSKYVFSNYSSALIDAKKKLNAGKRILFSGTPCQIGALKNIVGENPNLLCVEVICHGAPQQRYWIKYLREICNQRGKGIEEIGDINFRNKLISDDNYSFTIKFKDGNIVNLSDGPNSYMKAFIKNYILRESCFNCKFKYPSGTKADITIGDLWGKEKLDPNIGYNWPSLVICRTKQGENYLSNVKISKVFTLDQIIPYNKSLVYSSIRPNDYYQFKTYKVNSGLIPVLNYFTKTKFFSIDGVKRLKRFFIKWK